MLSSKKIELERLHFNPQDSITFEMAPRRQRVPVEIRNDEDVDVIVKWKSTRARIFSTEPNYAIIKSKQKMTFQLAFKGLERERSEPRDRFSAVISAIKSTDKPAKQIWKQYDLRKELLMGLRHKKFIFVIFPGVNRPNWWNQPILNDPESNIPTFGIDPEEDEAETPLYEALAAGRFQTVFTPIDQAPPTNSNQTDNKDTS